MNTHDHAINASGVPVEHAQLVFREIAELARNVGFEHCTYTIQMPLPLSRPVALTFSSDAKEPVAFRSADITKRSVAGSRGHGADSSFTRITTIRALSGAIGQLTLIRNPQSGSDAPIDDQKLDWLTRFSHERMTSLLMPRMLPEASVELTRRQVEILRWTADGKTVPEIAAILGISERTVKFHITNIQDKLRATNKLQAVVKAIALGLLL